MTEPATRAARRIPAARINLMANYAGRLFAGVCSTLFIPVYVHFMGVEAFGLVGFYASLLGVFTLLDLGMNATIMRELASSGDSEEQLRRARDLLNTLGRVYWGISIAIILVVTIGAHWLACHWLNAKTLPPAAVEHGLYLMGLTLGGQMLLGYYSAALFGLQHHVVSNLILATVAAVRSGGACLVLWLISSTIVAFFLVQAATVAIGLIATLLAISQFLPGKGRFRGELVHEIWHFTAGAAAGAFSAILLYQADKIVLSRILPLKEFGFYAFAVSAASAMQYLSSPIYTTFFPSFSQKVKAGAHAELVTQYHRASQVLAVAIFPAAAILVFFSGPLIIAWTGNEDLYRHAAPLVSLLGLGMAFNAIAPLTYSVQLAYGWTRLAMWANIVLFLILIVALIVFVPKFGVFGAAVIWMLVGALYLICTAGLMYRRILVGEQTRWYFHDLLPAGAAVVVIATLIRLAVPVPHTRLLNLLWIGVTYGILFTAAVAATHETRAAALRLWRKFAAKRICS